MPRSCPPTSFAPLSIRVDMVLFPCILRTCVPFRICNETSGPAARSSLGFFIMYNFVRKCYEYLVSLIILECSLCSRTEVCDRMIRRTIHIPGTYHTTAAAVPVPVIILQSVTASLRLLDAVVRLHRTGTRACSRCVVVFFSFCSGIFFSISSRINPRIL